MKQVTSYPCSIALENYLHSLCPIDAHIHITLRGTWSNMDESFRGQYVSSVTTSADVVRAFSFNGVTFWTLEKWTHDNGYRCELVILTKAQFLHLINS